MSRLAVFALCAALPCSALAAPETYTLDPYHTYPHFAVDHLGFSTMWGRFDKSSGKFTLDREAKTGTVEINVETASVNTGDGMRGGGVRSRDDHLRSPDFFNVQEFPRMTYRGKIGKWTGDAPATIDGELELLGVRKPLTLTVDRWKCGAHPMKKNDMCGGNASGTVKRSDFGMKYGLPGVGDELKLFFEFEANKD